MNILNLSLANIRKGKGAALSLLVLILAASLLLNSGITIKSAMGTFYEQKAAELHDAHVNIAMAEAHYKPAIAEFIQSYPGMKTTEAEHVILLPRAVFRYNKKVKNDFSVHVSLLNADAVRRVAPLKLVGKTADDPERSIYVPYSLKARGGYELGDAFSLTYRNITYSYRIGGFFESTLMGASSMKMLKFYLPDAGYRQLSRELGPEAKGVLLSAVFNHSAESDILLRDYSLKFAEPSESTDISFWSGDIGLAETSTLTVNIIAVILLAFAVIMALVSFMVIKFRIADSIEQGMINIGVLKAIGYTSRQILASIILQFMLIGVTGTAIGLLLSNFVLPAFSGIISSLTGLLWGGGTSPQIFLASAAIILVFILAAALTSSRRVHRLQPVAALRGGISTHSFKRNSFPLHKARGGLQVLLACKSIVAGSRQNLMMVCIIAAVTFASFFSVVLYYNISGDKTAFFQMFGTETPNVGIEIQPGRDSAQLHGQVARMPGVEKVSLMDELTLTINGHLVSADVSDDYGMLDNYMIVKGRYAVYDNEIVITGTLSRLLGKSVGDTLQVKLGNTSGAFLITGLNQSYKEGNGGASITIEGAKRLLAGYIPASLNVYLKEGTDKLGFMREVQAKHGDLIQSVTDADKSIADQTEVYTTALFSVMAVIVAITVLIVTLVLYLVIQTTLIKRKRELGIMRTLGYTAFQLRTQITLSYVPVVAAGVSIGAVLGGVYINPMLARLLSRVGVMRVELIVRAPLILGLGTLLILFAYLVSMLASRRIKRITAYGLITE